MPQCTRCNPPWSVRRDDNYCSGCGAKLHSLDLSGRSLTLLTEEGVGSALITIGNRSNDPEAPAINDLHVTIAPDAAAEPLITLVDPAGDPLAAGAPIVLQPGQEKRLQLTAGLRQPVEEDTYCSLTLQSNDPQHLSSEIRVGITSTPPKADVFLGSRHFQENDTLLQIMVPTSLAGGDTNFTESFRIMNAGGGYLEITSIVIEGEQAIWIDPPVVPPPLRHAEQAPVDIHLRTRLLPPEPMEAGLFVRIRLADGTESRYRIQVSIRPPARLDVRLPQFRRDPAGSFVLECLPYGRRDFEVQLINAGGDPLNVVSIQFDRPEVLRVYRAGDVRVPSGPLTTPFRLEAGETSSHFKLSMDLERLDFGRTHSIGLIFNTEPVEAGAAVQVLLKVERKEFRPELGTYIGIDFGTTNSTVTIQDDSRAAEDAEPFVVLPIEEESAYAASTDRTNLLSALYFRDVDDPVVGLAADSIGTGKADRFLRSFKRTIGLQCPRYILGRTFSPQDLAEIIFSRLIERALRSLPAFTPLVVATCPANFADHQRRSTLRACRRALLKKMLRVHADGLQRETGAYFPHDASLGGHLEQYPDSRRVLETVARAAADEQPRFRWDIARPAHALLLLGHLAIYRQRFFRFDDQTEVEPAGDLLQSSDLNPALLRDVFEPLERDERAEFATSPRMVLELASERRLAELLDHIEDWVADVFRSWQLMDVQLLEEPTAAAYAYILRNMVDIEKMAEGERRYIAVYDFGGGTFDISVVCITRSQSVEVEVIQSDGINEMGGDDLDFALIRHYLDKRKPEDRYRTLIESSIYSLPLLYPNVTTSEREQRVLDNAVKNTKMSLKRAAEGDKILFSIRPELTQKNVDVDAYDPIAFSVKSAAVVSRAEFDGLIRARVGKTIEKFGEVIKRARHREQERGRDFRLDKVVLAGKTSRLPLIRKMMLADADLGLTADRFDESLRNDEKNCVARGAAYYGYIRGKMASQSGVIARARTLPQSVGVVQPVGFALQEMFESIHGLEKGTSFNGGALRGTIERVWQRRPGKVDIAQNAGPDNRFLRNPDVTRVGVFAWRGFAPGATPEDRIRIHVSVDANGLISVSGELRGAPFGSYHSIPPAFQDKPVFVFI